MTVRGLAGVAGRLGRRIAPTEAQERLAEREEQPLAIVARHTQLPDGLLLGRSQLRGREEALTEARQFGSDKVERLRAIARIGAEIDRTEACVGVARQVRLHAVDQPATLAQGHV